MGPDELYPWFLRELVDEVAKPLSIIFERSWQSGEAPTDWRRGNTIPFLKREKRKTWGPTGQSSAWQDDGADPPRIHAKVHG